MQEGRRRGIGALSQAGRRIAVRRSNRIEALAAKFQVKKTEFELERDSHLHVRREGEGGSSGGAE